MRVWIQQLEKGTLQKNNDDSMVPTALDYYMPLALPRSACNCVSLANQIEAIVSRKNRKISQET